MIKFENNILNLNDNSCYDLNRTDKKRVIQGLKFQMQEKTLTKKQYAECILLISK